MKRVLMWDLNFKLKNTGGPAGYLYNIKTYIDTLPEDSYITFLSDLYSQNKQITNSKITEKVKSVNNWFLRPLTDIYRSFRFLRNKSPKEILQQVDLSLFDVIHFHNPIDLYLASDIISNYKGIILLTSHSPEPIASELINHIYRDRESILKPLSYALFASAERQAFKRADYIMFPTIYSSEPYMVDKKLEEILISKKDVIRCCPTGTLDVTIEDKNSSYFNELCGTPKENFNIVYLGRHNDVKGYGDLKEIAKVIFSKHKDVSFIIGGLQGPIDSLQHEQWIELGWTNKAAEIIRNADVFILPNRQTYFDLIALEVLRAGTPIIMSNTGGNKYFAEIANNGEGIYLYDRCNMSTCIDAVEQLIIAKQDRSIGELGKKNRNLWEHHFTLAKYLETVN